MMESTVFNNLGLVRPSKIQSLSYRDVLSGRNVLIADQTGSGKTLAYLLPTLQTLVAKIRNKALPPATPYEPYVVILTPTAELAQQVASVVRQISNSLKFRSSCLTAASNIDSERKKLRLGW
jgi:superfamily II DNA/RNA helicase